MKKDKLNENEQLDQLCQYVKKNILRYDDNKAIPKYLVMRLKGLSRGQFIANNKQGTETIYGYDVILATFKYSSSEISQYLDRNGDKIKDERHLINLVMKFAENNINTVVDRLNQIDMANKQLEGLDNSQITAKRSKYRRKTKDKKIRRDLK